MVTILIVDDHVLNRQFLMVLLAHGGHRLVEAADGAEGLRLASSARPELIISDILMPGMDGHEFVRRLRALPALAATPVVFYTAAYREREADKMASACGVRWVLPKPSPPELILRTVQEALGLPFAPTALPPPQAPQAALDKPLNDYLAELEASSQLMSRLVDRGAGSQPEELQQLVQRLAGALASLQAVGLRLTALIDLGIALAAEREPRRVLEICCGVVQDICVARHAAIGVVGADRRTLAHYVTRGMQDSAAESPAPHAGILGEVLSSRSAIRRADLDGNPSAIGLPASHPPVHSLLAVPIATRTNSFGWLYLANKTGFDAFSEVDERAAVTVAAQLAVVYENLQLYGEIQHQHGRLKAEAVERKQAQEALRRSLRARTVTAGCKHVMVHAGDEQALLDQMCRTIVDAGAYRGAWISHGQGSAQRTVAWAGVVPEEIRAAGDSIRERRWPLTGSVGGTRSWMVVDLPANDEPAHVGGHMVSLPLKDGQRLLGTLTVCEEPGKAFDAEQLAMLEELAADVAFGILNLRARNARTKAERDLRATEDRLSGILESIDNIV